MMSNPSMHSPAAGRGKRNLFLQVVIGGIVGFLSMMGAMLAMRNGLAAKPTPDQALAMGVGVIYVVMAVFVMLGAAVPSVGAKLLNVADAEELQDDRRYLTWSGSVCAAFGAALIAAALAGQAAGPVSPAIALGLFIGATLLSVLAWRQMRARQDEFRRLVNAESSQASLVLVMLVYGGWAVAAQLGYASMFGPLTFVAGMLGLILVGAFIVIFQRGLIVH